ncbi:hypothetical protein Mal15_18860 [Stieleria maiorica]|uniref:Uncharacterized protein n=1 Tax=Stieleria maiorica TaxID=2795974 RepID=A0A5B9M9C6_9BACT|nr:hypothetical protein [Stieleria maiorica]QEF97841.1 hypothetical protein Mal15_18860 [Stieleria maiorica]
MLMRNPEHQVAERVELERGLDDPRVLYTPLEMLLGQTVLILLFLVAILLKEMA